ncbi:MAG: hypothetical protein ACOVNZ_11865, partial [Crocinitomicaceae bacterium]
MKNLIFFLFSILFCYTATGQGMEDFIKWQITVEKIDDSHANLVFTGKIIDGYHIFSLKHDPAKADGTGLVP